MTSKENPILQQIRRDGGTLGYSAILIAEDIRTLTDEYWRLIWDAWAATTAHRDHAVRVLQKLAAISHD